MFFQNTETLLLVPIISAFTAIAGAVGTIWLKELLDRKRDFHRQFEQTYIEEGINHLLWYLKTHEIYYSKLMIDLDIYELEDGTILPYIKLDQLETLPVDSMIKVEGLLRTNLYTMVILNLFDELLLFKSLSPEKRSKVLISDRRGVIANALLSLTNIRDHLLTHRINKNSYIMDIPQGETIMSQLKTSREAIERWNNRRKNRVELKSEKPIILE